MSRTIGAIAGSLALVGAAVLALLQSLPVTRWLGVGVLAVVAAAIAVREAAAWFASRASDRRKLEGALRQAPILVKDANPFALGVTPSEIADRYRGSANLPPYVSRDIDPTIDKLLRHRPFVAIVGPSKAGKSRSAFEAVLRIHPTRTLVAPDLPSYQREEIAPALESCIRDFSDQGVVIWLDDLQEYLRTRSIATQDLNTWSDDHPKVLVVATIRDGELAALQASGRDTDVEKILERAEMVWLPPLLSGEERAAAENVYPDEDFQDGIGVHLVAGPQLVQRFTSAREINPAAFALIAAAVDRRRAGVFEAATEHDLAGMAPLYFREVRPRSEFPNHRVTDALEWAAEPVIQDVGVLLRSEDDRYEPFEYITAFRDGEVAQGVGMALIPDEVWDYLIDQHRGWVLRSISSSARLRGRLDVAIRALEKVVIDEDPHIAAHGIDDLAAALGAAGDSPAAIERLRTIVNSEFGCVRASASYRLAGALGRSARDEREGLYRTVLEYPKSWAYPKAAVNLGLLLRSKTSVESVQTQDATVFRGASKRAESDQSLEDEAQKLFEEAIGSNDHEAIENGGNALGVLLCSRNEMEAGEEALGKGMEAGSMQAAVSLALTIYSIPGREAEAWQLVDRAEELRDEDDDPTYLHFTAGLIAEKRGDAEEAAARFGQVIASDGDSYRAVAMLGLARISLVEGSFDEAERLARAVLKGEDSVANAQALLDRIRALRSVTIDGK